MRTGGSTHNTSKIKHIKKKSKHVLAMTKRDPQINLDSPYQVLQDPTSSSHQPRQFYLETD